ncbi:MAG: CRTAC1 family protein, partial [Gammaproteobacteria bacterium]|nr:CRTAC1 family protein [Gammaproteobacteria bacterium]
YNGGGVGVADLNNDGLQDLIFTGNMVSTQVYLNQGDFKFKDITEQFSGLNNTQWFGGVSVGDVNNDGLPDLYLASSMSNDTLLRKNQLWINQGVNENGLPSYIEVADKYGVADHGYSIHSGFFDYDLDGDLDLYVLNNIVGSQAPTNYRDKMVDGSSINNDQLYQNQGDGTFKNVTIEAGIVFEGFGLGLAFGDINKDGYPDIYVSNDYISNDLVYINQKDGTFKNKATDILSYQSKFSMGNDLSDFNNDGNLDVVTLDMNPENYFRKKQTINGNSYYVYINDDKYGYQKQYVRNMLQVNNGIVDGELAPMSEIGQLAGIHQTEWSWSPLFADYDNDGDRDLLITNGFPRDLTDKDFTNYKAKMHGYLANDKQVISKIPIVKVSNYAYKNNGDYNFENVTQEWGLNIPSFSNGAAFVDLDNDGDLDYVVNNINDKAFIYKNNSDKEKDNSNFLSLKLVGSDKNKLGIGAKIELWADGKYQYAEQFLTRGYISSVDPIVHFGLGSTKKVDSLKIIWPSLDRVTLLKNVEGNQILEVKEVDAKNYTFKPFAGKKQYLFSEVDSLLTFTHVQEDYIDFFVTPYIKQHKFSQIGPCMTSGDINMDGLDDVIIGASDKQSTSVYIQTDSGFQKTIFPG